MVVIRGQPIGNRYDLARGFNRRFVGRMLGVKLLDHRLALGVRHCRERKPSTRFQIRRSAADAHVDIFGQDGDDALRPSCSDRSGRLSLGLTESDTCYHQLIQLDVRKDPGIANLLDLHDQIIDQDGGYWVKIEAWRVEVTADVPHGVRYSLTLHEPYGKRILGYDNAHAVKPPKKFKYAGRRLTYDHKHRHVSDKGVPYEFQDAQQLLIDFFNEVDRVLKEARQK